VVNNDTELYRNALLVMLTTLGIPQVYYGSEQALGGTWSAPPSDPMARQPHIKRPDGENREPLWQYGYQKEGLIGGTFMFDTIQRIIQVISNKM